MRRCATWALMTCAVLAWCITSHARQPLAQIPLDKCTPDAALVAADMDALNRQNELGPRIQASLKEVLAILARYPGHEHDQQAVMNFLSPADNVRMTEVLATSAQLNMHSFVEEQAQRDATAMMEILSLAQAARDGKTDLMKRALATMKADEDGKPRTGGTEEASAVYLALMRYMFKDAADLPNPAVTETCNVDLAFALEDGRAFKEITTFFQNDAEMLELMRVREKYHAAENQPVDTSPLSH
jgi:hypothetical protein